MKLAVLVMMSILMSGVVFAAQGESAVSTTSAKVVKLQKDCASGNADDCAALGLLYLQGREVERDYLKAVELLGTACEEGFHGCALLAAMYETGEGVKQDYSKAAKFYGQACGAREAVGCYNLASMYADGQEGIKQDYSKAAELYGLACHRGDAKGCFNLGSMYYYGQGVPQGKTDALKYYEEACELNEQSGCDAVAMLNGAR